MFPLYLQYLLIDFRQTFVTGASWDTDDVITFLGQKVKVQGHTIAVEAHSTRRYRRVQLFLVAFCVPARTRNSAIPHALNLALSWHLTVESSKIFTKFNAHNFSKISCLPCVTLEHLSVFLLI